MSNSDQDQNQEQNQEQPQDQQEQQDQAEDSSPQIIASTYEIQRKLGSGGGGVVYLARHLRLEKLVVLKADKRSLSVPPERLRREVDALKNLSHTYIPQVYDFIVEKGTVYTVIDYIEGESLDKPLERGERFSQAQVVEWACQLLEALCYLHSRPPHGILHSDIKPANVMLTPEGDIRLIDFNIALALGAEGAVRVGYSQGYASPEHYGIDYSSHTHMTRSTSSTSTALLDENGDVIRKEKPRTILLDVRSDIYSAGATLYHLFAGARPARDAKKVVPLSPETVSPAVSDIIRKSMDPDPDLRYQTAEEMLAAFEHLHENDPRARRHKKRAALTAVSLAALFLLGGTSTFAGLRGMEQAAQIAEEEERQAKESLAAVRRSESAYQSGDLQSAVEFAVQALHTGGPYRSEAQKALTDALGVYDLSDGFKSHLLLALPSEPVKVVLSPEGTRVAAMTNGELVVFETEGGERLASLPAEPSALSDVVFRDENTILYAGESGIRAYDLTADQELWSGQAATGISLSADGATAAAVYKDESVAVVYDAATGAVRRAVDFYGLSQDAPEGESLADPENDLFVLNGDGTRLAVSFSNGALWVFDLEDSGNDLEIYDRSDYIEFEGGFFQQYFAFTATKTNESVFASLDLDRVEQTDGAMDTTPFHTQAGESGIYVCWGDTLVKLDPETGEQAEAAYLEEGDIARFVKSGDYTLTVRSDSSRSTSASRTFYIFDGGARLLGTYQTENRVDFAQVAGQYVAAACRDHPSVRILRLKSRSDAEIFQYDPSCVHDEARLSADRSTVMLYRYDKFQLYRIDGTLISETELPDAGEIYDQQFRRDEAGSYLEVIYNDGLIRKYSAEDGRLLSEQPGETPDESLYEEFLTDRFRITSPLHGTPAAYDRQTGALVRELESGAYLTYVTQVGEFIVTEYFSTDGERYGLLLDGECRTLAKLPGLCDIVGDTLVFDDTARGSLRVSRIYSIEELLAMAQT